MNPRPHQETELKLRLTDSSLYDRLVTDPFLESMRAGGRVKEVAYDTVYFDTADRRLLRHGLSLRLRDTGTGYLATVKDTGTETGGLFVRGEWNASLQDSSLSVHTFSGLPVGTALAEAVGGAALLPVVRTAFKRISMDLQAEGSVVEFAADRGEIAAGDRREPLCEVELELKSGDDTVLLRLGQALRERWPLEAENKSKYVRGLLLAGVDIASRAAQ